MGALRWTRLSIRRYDEQFSRRVDPRGRHYYWLAGEVVNDLESAGEGPPDWPSDVAQIHANAPSITPISLICSGAAPGKPSQAETIRQLIR